MTTRSNAPLPPWSEDIVDEFGLDEGNIYPGAAPAPSATSSMAKSAVIIGVAFLASRLLGLLREIVLANRFGTSSEYDAYVSAFRIPDLLFLVIMSGSFGAAFIPVFGGFLARGEEDDADRLASAVITWTALTTIVLGLITFVFAGPLMRYVVAPDLPPDAMDLAIKTMRMLLLSPLLLGMGIAAKGILETHLQFTLPALAPVVYNLAIVLAALFLAPEYGIEGVTIGVLIGALLHVGIQIPGVIRTGMRFRPTLSRNVAGLSEVGILLLPRVIGQAAFQINFVAVNHFASQTGEGGVSALNYAWQMLMLPNGVLALSISTVVFPTMAAQFELGDVDAFRNTLQRGLRPLLLLLIPAAIGLFEFRTALFQTIFQSGNFTADSTILASEPLAFLALGLVWYGLVEVLARTFYAMKDTVTPVAAGIFIIVVNIVLSKALLGSMGHVGLALALSVSTGIEAFILIVILRRRIGGFGTEFGVWLSKIVMATAVMALVSALLAPKLDRLTAGDDPNRIIQLGMLAIAVGACAAAYFLAAWLLGLPEARNGMNKVRTRVRHLARIG
ncbi:MAG: murein biosynthesis integral membrane protein MurJ [Thermomicrobiales bacterium]|nr:murein biosynthesis integral membrane protein MurJ [Thermomicrobiales bacterium]